MSRTRPVLLAALAYCALTLAYSWPLALNLAHGVAHDPGDPLLNAWILWWSTKAVPLTGHWWNAPMFYPAVGTLAFSEHLLGLVPIAAPFIAISHHPLLGYNIALLASYIFSGLGAYFLVYTLTRRHDAAFVGGLAFAFAPYRAAQLPHIQVLSAYWTPVCLAALHRYDSKPRTRWAALAAAAWLMQALACGYYLFFLTVLLSLWFLWFAGGRWSVRQFAVVLLAWTVAALLLMPVLEGYKHYLTDTYGFTRGIGSIRTFSADVGSLLHASDELRLWGWVHAIRRPEGELFPGPTIVGLAFVAVFATRPFSYRSEPTRRRWWLRRIFGAAFTASTGAALVSILYGGIRLSIGGVHLVSVGRAYKPVTLAVIAGIAWMSTLPAVRVAAARRSPLAFYGLAAIAMWVFALGPDPTFFDYRALYRAPYGWLMRLPAFEGLRVPARFWMMTLVCLSVVAGFAIDRLRASTRRNLVVLAAVGLVLDGWPIFSVRPEPDVRPTPSGAAVRLDLPMTDERDPVALYRQTFDGIPLYNGFSGYGAPHQYAMRELLSGHDPRILRALAARGPLGVLIDHAGDPAGSIRRYITTYPGAVLKHTTPAWSSYLLPASESGDLLPDREGRPLPISALRASSSQPHAERAIDGNLRTSWTGGVKRAADFTVELMQPTWVHQIVTELGEFWSNFPEQLTIEVSPDGSGWETVFRGDATLHAYYAAVRHPRDVPLVFAIDRDGVRFIRLQHVGSENHDWSIAEVHVLGR